MGACCGKQNSGPDAEIYARAQRSRLPDTEQDREARRAAAAAAEARQQAWEQTPGGRAALKSVKAVQEERAAGGRSQAPDTSRDWLT